MGAQPPHGTRPPLSNRPALSVAPSIRKECEHPLGAGSPPWFVAKTRRGKPSPDSRPREGLRFRNLSSDALAQKNGLRTFLEEETQCAEAPDDCQSPGEALWNGSGGGLLWILDGLDEVIDPAARKKVSGWVQRAIKSRRDDWFLVTCRFAGYFRKGVPLGAKFVECHVRPLDDQQIQRFVRDWFAAAYGKLLSQKPQATKRAQAESQALLDILARAADQAGHIRELSTNPLLLTILCIVFHEERKLPTGRAELYSHCVRVLLEYWRQDLYESDLGTVLEPYDAEAAQAVLARVAWWMHQQQDRTAAPLDELARQAEAGLAQVAPSSGLGRDGQAFVQRMRDEAGILAMEGEGRCGFLHLSFQEYLAAEHAAREGLAQELASIAAVAGVLRSVLPRNAQGGHCRKPSRSGRSPLAHLRGSLLRWPATPKGPLPFSLFPPCCDGYRSGFHARQNVAQDLLFFYCGEIVELQK